MKVILLITHKSKRRKGRKSENKREGSSGGKDEDPISPEAKWGGEAGHAP